MIVDLLALAFFLWVHYYCGTGEAIFVVLLLIYAKLSDLKSNKEKQEKNEVITKASHE